MKRLRLGVLGNLVLVLSACGSIVVSDETAEFSLVVSMGAVEGAICSLEAPLIVDADSVEIDGGVGGDSGDQPPEEDIAAEGEEAAPVDDVEFATSITDVNGYAALTDVRADEFPLVVYCTGGQQYALYPQPAQTVELDVGFVLRTVIPSRLVLEKTGGVIAVTPFTDMAAELFTQLDVGDQDPFGAQSALQAVHWALMPNFAEGSHSDAWQYLLVPPLVMNAETPNIVGEGPQAEYAAYIAGFVGAADRQGLASAALLQQLRNDLLDGDDDLNQPGTTDILSDIVRFAKEYARDWSYRTLQLQLRDDEPGNGVIATPRGDSNAGGGSG